MSITFHKILIGASQDLSRIHDESINLVITSPPYPMIKMWDEIMGKQNPKITDCLEHEPEVAFELMHQELDKVWKECFRVMKQGGFLCINIGDATRTINGNFTLYNNHSRVSEACIELGFVGLPNIIWRKQTNAPNKFMGSGMLPCGAYITLEHEHILIFRKGNRRKFTTEEDKDKRRESAYFWEERNVWFSDLWDIKGTRQKLSVVNSRERNASFPLEIPYRLINMFSCKDDVVLDPFVGCGTTMLAAMLSRRNSIGIDIDEALVNNTVKNLSTQDADRMNMYIEENRIDKHRSFFVNRKANNKEVKYKDDALCGVMTEVETHIKFDRIENVTVSANEIDVEYFID